MKAVTYQGIKNVVVKEVPDPKIEKADDAIIRLTTTAICGSDLHLLHGMIPNLEEDYIIGHEPMGVVEEVGPGVTKLKKGDRVIIPFTIACGECFYCRNHLESQCDNSNGYGEMGGFFGYSGTTGGHPGGQAEYLRVPFANFTHFKIPESCEHPDEKLCLVADAMPTAYWSVDNAGIKQGDTVVVIGCGPVGLLAQKFAWSQGRRTGHRGRYSRLPAAACEADESGRDRQRGVGDEYRQPSEGADERRRGRRHRLLRHERQDVAAGIAGRGHEAARRRAWRLRHRYAGYPQGRHDPGDGSIRREV